MAAATNPTTADTRATLAGSSRKGLLPSLLLTNAVEAVCVIIVVDVQVVVFPFMWILYMFVLLFESFGSVAPRSKHVTNIV